MRKLSIKLKITIWFAISMLIITGITMGCVIAISASVIKKDTFGELVEVVEENADEIEYVADYNKADIDDDLDIYMQYKDGFLEIDDDFIRTVNGINCSVYDENGHIIYGEDILYKIDNVDFKSDGQVYSVKERLKNLYYCYDKEISLKNGDKLMIRGIIPSDRGNERISAIIALSASILPALVIISLAGGYAVADRSLSPVNKIIKSAERIHEGSDLSYRIEMPDESKEVRSLSDSLNSMLNRLEQSFKAEQQLTSDISHELRTPVSVIMSQCELSLESQRNDEEDDESFELILRQAKRMSSTINDMLNFTRLEKRDKTEEFPEINLSETVVSVCEDMALIKQKNISLNKNIEENITVNGDSQLISRLCVNLISNAYRYGKENGRIDVTLKTLNDEILLCVADNGIGISEEELPKIWNRFYRVDKSRSESGNGLGLNFVREIARLHGGYISVTSREGEGSTFIFRMPKK